MSPTAHAETLPTIPLGEMVFLTELQPSPLNPRKRFAEPALMELAANIQKHGVIVPLLVRRQFAGSDPQTWVGEVIDGERRYRASKLAGVARVPCVFRDELTDGEVIEIQLLSAIQRQDLTPLEEAAGFRALIDSNPSLYSAAYIADRVGRSERWVWDRMQLLDLAPLAKQLLEADLILVGHAEVLAKLKPEDQLRAIGEREHGDGYINSGLFEPTASRLGFDEPTDDEDDSVADPDADPVAAYRAYKAKTVKELEAWIARHVRFDVQHMATTAPLDFGPVFDRVQEALTKPGRGKKVVPITFEFTVHPDAKNDERTYGQSAWQRADGRDEDAPVCEHAVLGTVVTGRHYGQAFDVCIARDRCEVHWKDEIKAKAKNDELRAKGHGGQAAQREVVDHQKEEAQRAERERQRQEWEKLEVLLDAETVAQAKKVKALTPAQAKFIGACDIYGVADSCETHLGSKWFTQPAAAWLVAAVSCRPGYSTQSFDDYIKDVVKPLGLKVAPFDAILKALQPKQAAVAKTSKKPAAKTTKAAKKAKRR